MKDRILVWDIPTRIIHWLLVICFVGSWLTADSEKYRLVHVTLGYSTFSLMLFRIIWGFCGTRYARFSQFVRGPKAVISYLLSIIRSPIEHHTGHNPAGGIAIVLLILLGLITPILGWITYNEWAGNWLTKLHEASATAMLAIVIVHVIGVVVGSITHKENLVVSMFSGFKSGEPGTQIPSAYGWLGIVILIAMAGLWWWSMTI